MRADELAGQMAVGDRTQVPSGDRPQGYFIKKIWRPDDTPALRIVLLGEHWKGKAPVKMLSTTQPQWEVTRVVRGYGHRWTGTETLPRDGKPQVGWGDWQLRRGEGQTRPCSLGLLVHRLLVAPLRQGRARAWATAPLTTIGEAWRAVLRDTLGKTIAWAIERATLDGWEPMKIKAHLQLV